jgi:hypothetical protein
MKEIQYRVIEGKIEINDIRVTETAVGGLHK